MPLTNSASDDDIQRLLYQLGPPIALGRLFLGFAVFIDGSVSSH